MAGDWIKWCKGLARKREVVVLSSMLDRGRHEIAARLMELWEWLDDNTSESDIDDEENVSLILGDKPTAFVDALLGLPGMAEAMASPEVRWLEPRSGGRIVFPNLARHNGTSAKTRAYEQSKKRKQRSRDRKIDPDTVPKKRGQKGDTSSLSLTLSNGVSSKFDSILRNTSYDDARVREAIEQWAEWHYSQTGRKFTDLQCQSMLSQAASNGWSVEKLARSVPFSISKNARSLKDPDDDWDKRRTGSNGSTDAPKTAKQKAAELMELAKRDKR